MERLADSVCIHQCSYGEINIIHILNSLAVGKQFVDQGQCIGPGDQIYSAFYIFDLVVIILH